LRWRDRSIGESFFELQRRKAGVQATWKTIKLLKENLNQYVDGSIKPGETYEYRVRARGFLEECIPHSRWSANIEVIVPL
jgi:hypothetical protein